MCLVNFHVEIVFRPTVNRQNVSLMPSAELFFNLIDIELYSVSLLSTYILMTNASSEFQL